VLAVEVAGPLMFGAPLNEPVAAAIAPLGRRVLEQVKRWAAEDSGRGPEDTVPRGSGGTPCMTTTRSARS
jgi:hypothetical protein